MNYIIALLLFFTLLVTSAIGQIVSADSLNANAPVNRTMPIVDNPEKKAWELVRIKKPGYEKSRELRAYEDMLLKMRSGTNRLALVLREFESYELKK